MAGLEQRSKRGEPPNATDNKHLANAAHEVVAFQRCQLPPRRALEQLHHERMQLVHRRRPRCEAAKRHEDGTF